MSFFTFTTAEQTDSADMWAEPTNTAHPTMGRVTNITTPEKKNVFCHWPEAELVRQAGILKENELSLRNTL